MRNKLFLRIIFILIIGIIPQCAFASDSDVEFEAVPLIEKTQGDNSYIRNYTNDSQLITDEYNDSKIRKAAAIPAEYSLVDNLPPVRDQLDTGACWAFAALASVESNMINKGLCTTSVDFSEYHLAWFSYNGKSYGTDSLYAGRDSFVSSNPYYDGGNSYMAGSTLARWYGAVDQGMASNPLSLSADIKNESKVHIEDVNWLPVPTTEKARKQIKQYILNNGAVTLGYCHHDRCYNEYTNTHYCLHGNYVNYFNDAGYHDVNIVGWNDSKGAWLVRNSWGDKWGDNGYFYISYKDTTMVDLFGYQTGSSPKTYDYIYQYDGVGYGDNVFYDSSLRLAANRYTARKDFNLKAVGTYAPVANSKVYVRIFLNPKASSPVTGIKLYEKTYSVSRAGYHTLEIDKNLYIPKDYTYSVVVRSSFVKNGRKYYTVMNETELIGDNYCTIDYADNQSYIYKNGSWKDVQNTRNIYDSSYGEYYDIGSGLAKAFGIKTGNKAQILKVDKKNYKKANGSKAFNIKAEVTKGTGKLRYKSGNPAVASVNSSGKVTMKKPGRATITVTAAPNSTYKSVSKKITVIVTPSKQTIKKLTSKRGQITINWTWFKNADGYQVVAARDSKFTKDKRSAIVSGRNMTKKTFTGLKLGKKYYAKVRAYKIINGEKVYGPFSSVKSITVKKN